MCVELSDLTASTFSLFFSIPRRQHLINLLPHIGADAYERSTAQRHSKFSGQNGGAQELRRGTFSWVARCSERGVGRMLPALARW